MTTIRLLFFALLLSWTAQAQITIEEELREQFALPGQDCPTAEEASAHPAVIWARENLRPEDLAETLLTMANSQRAEQRFLYLLLRQAFNVREAAPPVYPGLTWPTQRALQEIDYLIIGSGPAGSVLAYELSRNGYKTVLVERGSLVRPRAVDSRALGFLKEGGGAVPTADSFMFLRNGRAVGGGATVNVDLAFAPTLPFVRKQLDKWNQPGFSAEKVARAYAWVKETIGTRTPPLGEVNRNNRILLDGAEKLGLKPAFYDLNTRSPGSGVTLANDKLGPAERLLRRALLEGYPLQVLWDLEVRKILVGEGRAVGVEVKSLTPPIHPAVVKQDSSTTREIKAKNVIVSAGTLGSATILLRSGLGGEQVGKGVLLHPSMPLIGHFQEHIGVLDGTASTVYATDPKRPHLLYECMSAGPDYAGFMLFGTASERARLVERFDYLGGFGLLLIDEPHPLNRIELDDKGNPQVYYQLRGEDRERFKEGVRQGVEMLLAGGAEEVYLPTTEPLDGSNNWDGHLQPLKGPATVECIPGRTIITSAHMQGSCKMGHSPKDSVVGPDFKVWGYDNLYVCDTSIFPTSVGANPMQMAYTTAKLLADRLATSDKP